MARMNDGSCQAKGGRHMAITHMVSSCLGAHGDGICTFHSLYNKPPVFPLHCYASHIT
jgi:hypothetical protein